VPTEKATAALTAATDANTIFMLDDLPISPEGRLVASLDSCGYAYDI
jgi:hypothetical protein